MPTNYTINGTGEIDAGLAASFNPSGIPTSVDTVTFAANQRLVIKNGVTFDAMVVAAAGTSATQRSGFIIEGGGTRIVRATEQWGIWNIHQFRGAGVRTLLLFADVLFTTDGTSNSTLYNVIDSDALGRNVIHSEQGMHGAPNVISGTSGAYRNGLFNLYNTRCSGVTVRFGGGLYTGHHYRCVDVQATHIGEWGKNPYSNINCDEILENCDIRGKTNVTASDTRMVYLPVEPNSTSIGTGTKRFINNSFSAEVTLPFNPAGFTEVVFDNTLIKTIGPNIGFFCPEAVAGDSFLVPNGVGLTCSTAGVITNSSGTTTVRVGWFKDVDRGIARPIRLIFGTSAGNPLSSIDPAVTGRFDRLRQILPSLFYCNWMSWSNLLSPTVGLDKFFSAHAGVFGDIQSSTPITNIAAYPFCNNPHTMENSCQNISDIVIEAVYPSNSTDSADHFIVTQAGTHNIIRPLIVDGRGGVLMNGLGRSGGDKVGVYNLIHPTYVFDLVTPLYGLAARNETLGVFAPASSLNILSGIYVARSNPSGATAARWLNFETAGPDQLESGDYNILWGIGNDPAVNFYNLVSTTKGAYGTAVNWGLNDLRIDPKLFDMTRSLLKWARLFKPTIADEYEAIDYMIDGVNGYDRATDTLKPELKHSNNLESYLAYMRYGFRPQNYALLNYGHDGVTAGALPYLPIELTANPSSIFTRSAISSPSGSQNIVIQPSNIIVRHGVSSPDITVSVLASPGDIYTRSTVSMPAVSAEVGDLVATPTDIILASAFVGPSVIGSYTARPSDIYIRTTLKAPVVRGDDQTGPIRAAHVCQVFRSTLICKVNP